MLGIPFLARLHEVGAALNRLDLEGPEDLQAGLDVVARAVESLLEGARVAVCPLAGTRPRAPEGAAEEVTEDLGRPDGLWARALAGDTATAPGLACLPLEGSRATLGVLYLAREGLTEEDLLLAGVFRHRAAAMLDLGRRRLEARRDLERKEGEMARLRRAVRIVSSRAGLEDTLKAILEMALEVTGARYGIFRLLDLQARSLVTQAVAGEGLTRPLVEALPVEATSITGWVATHRQAVVVPDLRREPWSALYYPLDESLEMRAEVAVPLVGAGGVLQGVLNLESPQVGAFGEADRQLLETLATQAVIAIQEVRLLDALQEVAQLLLREPARPVLDRICALACELLNGDLASVVPPGGEPLQGPRVLSADLPGRGTLQMVRAAAQETEWDARVLRCLAHHAALALENEERREALRLSRARRTAAESLAALGDMAANMMHRVNNKVGTIPVRVEGIQERCREALEADPYLARHLAGIETSARQAMEVVRESVQVLRASEASPVPLARAVAAAVREAALPEAVRVEVAGLEALPPVVSGERGLALIFLNLLDNAVKAMEGRGTLRVEGRPTPEGGSLVRVADTGPGIPPDLHDSIFELSFSGQGPAEGERLGFGLWWVRTLMMRLGGAIAVESDGRTGTAFVLRFPAPEDRP